jgi:hypothetical protein
LDEAGELDNRLRPITKEDASDSDEEEEEEEGEEGETGDSQTEGKRQLYPNMVCVEVFVYSGASK